MCECVYVTVCVCMCVCVCVCVCDCVCVSVCVDQALLQINSHIAATVSLTTVDREIFTIDNFSPVA